MVGPIVSRDAAGAVAEPHAGPSLRPNADIIDVLMEIAVWSYVHGWSQVRIARALDLDPSTVSRYLKRARDEGIVRIEIRRPPRPESDLSLAVAERHGLSRVIVVPAGADPLESVALAAATCLDPMLRAGLRLGVSWGHTLAAVIRHLRPDSSSGLKIAQIAGGIEGSVPDIQGYDLIRSLGALYPRSALRYLYAPAIVDSAEIRDAIVSDRRISASLRAAAASEIALVGIGSLDEGATLVQGGYVSATDRKRLLAQGAVGNMNTRFFDLDGRPVGDLDDRTIAISWEQLRAIPTVLAVAAGEHKATAILGALRTGCVDVLVTDDVVARSLLKAPPRR